MMYEKGYYQACQECIVLLNDGVILLSKLKENGSSFSIDEMISLLRDIRCRMDAEEPEEEKRTSQRDNPELVQICYELREIRKELHEMNRRR